MITCAGVGLSYQKLKLIKESRLHKDITLIGVDIKKNEAVEKIIDAFETVPFASNKNYIFKIKKIILKYKVNLVIPCSDEEALILAKNRKLLENSHTKIFVDNYKTLETLSSKVKTYKLLENFSKYIPEYYLCESFKDINLNIKKILKKNNFFVIKPAEASRGGKNVCVVENTTKVYKKYFNQDREIHSSISIFQKEIKKTYKGLFPLVIMEKLFQPTYDLDILSNEGKMIQCVSRYRIDPMLPNNGHVVFNSNHFNKLAKKLSSSLSLNGIYDCDLMVDNNKQLKILEINPRQSGSISVSMSAGINLYDQIFSLVRNKKIKTFKNIKKTKIIPIITLKKI